MTSCRLRPKVLKHTLPVMVVVVGFVVAACGAGEKGASGVAASECEARTVAAAAEEFVTLAASDPQRADGLVATAGFRWFSVAADVGERLDPDASLRSSLAEYLVARADQQEQYELVSVVVGPSGDGPVLSASLTMIRSAADAAPEIFSGAVDYDCSRSQWLMWGVGAMGPVPEGFVERIPASTDVCPEMGAESVPGFAFGVCALAN